MYDSNAEVIAEEINEHYDKIKFAQQYSYIQKLKTINEFVQEIHHKKEYQFIIHSSERRESIGN